MSDEIKVTVMRYADRPNLVLAYVDPVSEKRKTKSAKTSNEKAAWKAAAAWEEELRAGPQCPPSKVTWAAFRERYEAEARHHACRQDPPERLPTPDNLEKHLTPGDSTKSTPRPYRTSKRSCKPRTVKGCGKAEVTVTVKETTIVAYSATSRALRWAESVGMIGSAKDLHAKGKQGPQNEGRALVGEQFDRMLAAAPKVRPKDTVEWQRYLTGLWLSGLRLGRIGRVIVERGGPVCGRSVRFASMLQDQGRGAKERT